MTSIEKNITKSLAVKNILPIFAGELTMQTSFKVLTVAAFFVSACNIDSTSCCIPSDSRCKALYLLNLRAIQGTSWQMLQNIYDLYHLSPLPNLYLYMEEKQLPLDFKITSERFQHEKQWICPLAWDTRQHGDKFTMIE